jgi:mannose/fructose-specific phosphotransferase system component IIA
MIGFVIASHGQLAAELLATAEQIVGVIPQAAT